MQRIPPSYSDNMYHVFGLSVDTASLCLVAITHTYLLFHCFPYIGYMSLTLPHTVDSDGMVTVDSVGWYAGFLGTAFTAGRCLSFVPWKRIRRRVGVKNTLLLSLLFEALCSIWFGMSTTYLSAIVSRFTLGLSNTLSGCIKRIALNRVRAAAAKKAKMEAGESYTSSQDDQGEEKALARVLAFMWVRFFFFLSRSGIL